MQRLDVLLKPNSLALARSVVPRPAILAGLYKVAGLSSVFGYDPWRVHEHEMETVRVATVSHVLPTLADACA